MQYHSLLSLSAILIAVTSVYTFTTEEWGDIYECEDEFDSLTKMTRSCRETSYISPLSDMRKTMDMVNGDLMANILEDYCKQAEKVDPCVEYDIAISSCSLDAREIYLAKIDKSNWMCHAGVMQNIAAKLRELPAVSLKTGDFCYRESIKRTYQCVHRFLANRPTSKAAIWNRALASLPCAYRKLKKVCPAKTAFLLTLVNFDWLIMPPALGVNVTEAIMNMIAD